MAPSTSSSILDNTPLSTKVQHVHPYAPLSANEITYASTLLSAQWPEDTDIHYKTVTLAEPPKRDVVPYIEAEARNATLPTIDRKAFVSYYLRKTNKLHEAIINLSEGGVERNVRLGQNQHGCGDGEEILLMEQIALNDEVVKHEIEKLHLPQGAVVVADPWIYGMDRYYCGHVDLS